MADVPHELKSYGRPPAFGGRDEEWPDWSFVMKAYLSMMGEDLARALDDIETVNTVISSAILEARVPGISPLSRQTYYQLAMTCKGTALGIVKAVERNNGVEAWRRLCQRYQPDAGPRMQQMMTRILTPGDFP